MMNALVHDTIYSSPLFCEASTLGFSAIFLESLVAVRAGPGEGLDAWSRDVYNLLTIVDLEPVALACHARGT
jgi:hypothetical protein